jgi:hypothetical protein
MDDGFLMSENHGNELEMLKQVCTNLGAPEDRVETMALQLLKRAGQLAKERETNREDELRYLLELIVAGREGKSVGRLIRRAGEDRLQCS